MLDHLLSQNHSERVGRPAAPDRHGSVLQYSSANKKTTAGGSSNPTGRCWADTSMVDGKQWFSTSASVSSNECSRRFQVRAKPKRYIPTHARGSFTVPPPRGGTSFNLKIETKQTSDPGIRRGYKRDPRYKKKAENGQSPPACLKA